MTIAAACAPPGGGRNPVTPRFIRHFSVLCFPTPSVQTLQQIINVRRHTYYVLHKHVLFWFRNIIMLPECILFMFSSSLVSLSHSSISPYSSLFLFIWTLISACSHQFSLPILIQAFLRGFLREFSQEVKDCAHQIEYAVVGIYNRLSVDLLPTPAKFHYVFNLWDFFRCVQGETWADMLSAHTDMLTLDIHGNWHDQWVAYWLHH